MTLTPSMIRVVMVTHPVDFTPPLEAPPPHFCQSCWTAFAGDLIDAEALLRSITSPIRRYTSWGCPNCTLPAYDTTEPLHPEWERHAALTEIRDHVARWAVEAGIKTDEEYRREMAYDDF